MKPLTRELWTKQDRHPGDRERLFRSVGSMVSVTRALYPGSYVDLAASFVFDSVTYVDIDRRAAAFFADEEGVREIIAERDRTPTDREIRFIHADYATELPLEDGSFDLLVSLFAGFVSEACLKYLRIGGTLLVNPSHGDAAMASIDPRLRLTGVVLSAGGDYRVSTQDLADYLIPKTPQKISAETLHALGRGIAYTKPAFAYLFERVS